MCSIKEVRSGKTTDALKNKEIAGIYPDECAFSIVFGDNFESMDLIANTADEANIWVTGLTCLINTNTRSMTCKYLEDFKGDSHVAMATGLEIFNNFPKTKLYRVCLFERIS